jgi:hypothetical protein
MFHRIRLSMLPSRTGVLPLFAARMVSTAVLLSLLLSLVLPVTVYADDAAPPTETPAAETAAVDEGSTGAVTAAEPAAAETAPVDSATTTAETAAVDEGSTGAVAAAEPAAAESAPVDSAASTEAAVIADPAAETAPAEEILATVPEGTEVVVLDENGESVPLATSEAAEIIAAGDPIWCPTGVAPNWANPLCSFDYGSINALVTSGFVPTGNGTIWVKYGDAAAGVTIDDVGPWSSAVLYSLTIQGGWNGTYGSTALYPLNPISTFKGAGTDWLWIKNWVGPITLNNLTFQSSTYNGPLDYNTLLVQTKGNIVLNKVQVLDALNTGVGNAYGATLDNTTGSGNVTVTNGVFTNNEKRGLTISSKGAVTLKNVAADYNGDTGLWIVNNGATGAKPVTVTNAEFKGNFFIGLDVRSNGAVTLTNLVATYNSTGDGVYVINTNLGVAPVTINGVNNFSNNGGNGLEVASKGPIKVSNTTANYNVSDGVYLNTYAQPVTILGFLTAIYNGWDGLGIETMGSVAAANLTLSYNTGASGAYINNTNGPLLPYTPHPVTITGTNFFNDNKLNGLVVYCDGAITLSSITAIHNGITNNSTGVYLQNNYLATAPQNVTISGTNVFNYNSKHGLEVYSFGAITLSNVTASYNWYDAASGAGVYLDNKTDATLAKPVTLSGVNSFTWNDQEGLYILSKGAVTLNKITTTYNGFAGVIVDNNGSPTLSGVTGLGYLIALNNHGYGLLATSDGAVKFSNLTIKNNFGYGAVISNTNPPLTPKPVTITGTNLFADNDYYGLSISSDGAVTLSNITALYNGITHNYSGVYITNLGNPNFPQNVTISGNNVFSNNSYNGLEVYSYGAITLSNVTAEYNFYDALSGAGVYLDNNGGTLARPVTLSGVNTFNFNQDQGLYIESLGAVTLSKITAKFNLLEGVYVYNENAHFQSKISVLGYGLFEGNLTDGVDLYSNGAISLANVNANFNKGYGAYLWTKGLTAPQAVTLTGNNNFIWNGTAGFGSGLLVNADGNILVSNINASYNQYRGADLDNWNNWNDHTPEPNFATYGSVTLTGFGNFIGNLGDDGLYIFTNGSATVNHATADMNGWNGVDISSYHNVTLVCSSAYANWAFGLNVWTPFLLTIKGFYTLPTWAEVLSYGSLIRTGCP